MPRQRLSGGSDIGDRGWRAEDVFEIAWSVLPPFQGRGAARVAAAQVIPKSA